MNASEHDEMRQVNGVFTGGGAKLIAYVGALQATHERGLWFGSVAGSSAGAITAALIAAGMQPDELEAAIPSGFAQLETSTTLRIGRAIAGTATLRRPRTVGRWHRSGRLPRDDVALQLPRGVAQRTHRR